MNDSKENVSSFAIVERQCPGYSMTSEPRTLQESTAVSAALKYCGTGRVFVQWIWLHKIKYFQAVGIHRLIDRHTPYCKVQRLPWEPTQATFPEDGGLIFPMQRKKIITNQYRKDRSSNRKTVKRHEQAAQRGRNPKANNQRWAKDVFAATKCVRLTCVYWLGKLPSTQCWMKTKSFHSEQQVPCDCIMENCMSVSLSSSFVKIRERFSKEIKQRREYEELNKFSWLHAKPADSWPYRGVRGGGSHWSTRQPLGHGLTLHLLGIKRSCLSLVCLFCLS